MISQASLPYAAFLCVLLILSHPSSSSSLALVSKDNFCYNGLSKLILRLANHFDPGFLVHVVQPDDSTICSCACNNFVEEEFFSQWQIVVTQQNSHELVRDGLRALTDVFILIMNNYSGLLQLSEVVNELNKYTKSWNPSAKFLIMTFMVDVNIKQAKNQIVTDILNFLWNRNIFRVAVVLLELDGNEASVSLFSASPFLTHNSTCKEITSFSQLQEIDLNNVTSDTSSIVGYEFELPDSFSGCKVNAKTYHFPPYAVAESQNSTDEMVYSAGIEVELVMLLGKIYNLSIEISSAPFPGWTQIYPNGTSVGMLQEVLDYKIDMAFAGGIPPSSVFFQLSLSNAYIFNSISFYVPEAGIIPNSVLVLHSFTGVTWLLLALAFLFVTTLYLIMNGLKLNDDLEFVDLTMVALTLGFSTRWTKKTHLRLILLSWSLFSLHLIIMFNTRLFSVLTGRPVDPGVKTIEDLSASKFRLCISAFLREFYLDRTEGLVREILEDASNLCEITEDSVEEFLKHRNFSILVKDDNMSFLVNEKRANIHRLKQKFLTYPVLMSFSKHNIVVGYLNRLIFNVTESGLVSKWLSDARRKVKTKYFSRETHSWGIKSKLLSKEDFVWLYVLFIVGQAIAAIVFLFEISCNCPPKHVS